MRIPTILLMSLTLAPLAACQTGNAPDGEAKKAGLEVLPNIPMPPGGEILTAQNTDEAMQMIAVTEQSTDSVLTYYRSLLTKEPYRLVSETTSPDGMTSFYVEQDGPGLWIMVQKNGETGAMVTIAGAMTDSAAVAQAKREAMTRPAEVVPPGGKKPD
jgi:hypothetical protein